MDAPTQNLDCNKTINQFGEELTRFGVGMDVKGITHSQQQPQAPKTHKKESTVRLTTRITKVWPPKVSPLQA